MRVLSNSGLAPFANMKNLTPGIGLTRGHLTPERRHPLRLAR